MRILVARPAPGGPRTAALLRTLGHDPVALPIAEVRPTGRTWPDASFDAIALTSANALMGLEQPAATRLRAVPLHAVGERTARDARDAGFTDVHVAAGDAAALARSLAASLPRGARVLYPAGAVRKPDLEQALAAAGLVATTVETYEAAPLDPAALGVAIDRLASGVLRIDAVLHYSRAGATAFLAGARSSRHEAALLALPHVALSADVAEPLRKAGATRIVVAARPDEGSLLDCIASLG